MKNNQIKSGTKFWAELQVQSNGQIKIKKANKLTNINQFVRRWTPINARNLARIIAQSELVTR